MKTLDRLILAKPCLEAIAPCGLVVGLLVSWAEDSLQGHLGVEQTFMTEQSATTEDLPGSDTALAWLFSFAKALLFHCQSVLQEPLPRLVGKRLKVITTMAQVLHREKWPLPRYTLSWSFQSKSKVVLHVRVRALLLANPNYCHCFSTEQISLFPCHILVARCMVSGVPLLLCLDLELLQVSRNLL